MIDTFNNNELPRISKRKKTKDPYFMKGLMPKKKEVQVLIQEEIDDRPSETPTNESANSNGEGGRNNKKSGGGWKKIKGLIKTYTKKPPSSAQTTATKTPNPSIIEEETKKGDYSEELNVQIIEDNEQFNR